MQNSLFFNLFFKLPGAARHLIDHASKNRKEFYGHSNSVLGIVLIAGLTSCATTPLPPIQDIDIVITRHDRLWSGKLDCLASNSLDNIQFVAPGKVTVPVSSSPLQINCKAFPADAMDSSTSLAIIEKKNKNAIQNEVVHSAGTGAISRELPDPATKQLNGPGITTLPGAGSGLPELEVSIVIDSLKSRNIRHYPTRVVLNIGPAVVNSTTMD